MEIAEKMLAVALSFAILVQAIVVRRIVGTWLFPASLFSLFWFFATAVPLVFLFTVPFNPTAMAYIFAACVAFSVTAIPFRWRAAFVAHARHPQRADYNSPFMLRSFFLLSAGAAGTLVVSIAEQGFSLADILFDFYAVSNQYIAKRYSDDLTVSIFSQLSFVLMYPAAILGGLVFDAAKSGRQKFFFGFIVLLPSILAMLVQGAKGNLFLVLFFFWGAILMNKLNKRDLTLVRKINWVKTAIYLGGVIVMLLFSFMSRGLYEESNNNVIVQGLIRYFVSYSSAHLYGFSDWFSHYTGFGSVMNYDLDGDANGFYTFTSLFKIAGSQKTTWPGVYGEYFYYGEYISSNIYTWFRGLILDFGISGSFAFMFLFGAVSHFMFFWGLVAKNTAIPVSFFIHFVGFVYSTYIISLLMWNSAYSSFIIVTIILLMNRRLGGDHRPTLCSNPAS